MRVLRLSLIVLVGVGMFAVMAHGRAVQEWTKQKPGDKRFKLLAQFSNEAVWDKETGLVWDASPSAVSTSHSVAINHCALRELGGRFGWRVCDRDD